MAGRRTIPLIHGLTARQCAVETRGGGGGRGVGICLRIVGLREARIAFLNSDSAT